MSEKLDYRLGFWCAIGAAAGFSAKAIFVKLAYRVPLEVGDVLQVAPVTLLMLRMLFSSPVFAVAALRTGGEVALTLRQWLALAGVGLAGYYGASILDFLGLQFISAGLERLILFTYPSLALLLGVVFLGKRPGVRDIGALALTYLGIAIAFVHDVSVAGDIRAIWLGTGLVFASSLSYAVYLVGGGELIKSLGSSRFTALSMLVATVGTLIHYGLARPWSDMLILPWPLYVLAAAMALFSTVIPVFLQSVAIRQMGATRASVIGMIGPVATIFLGWIALDEAVSLFQIIGATLVIGGVALLSRR